MSNLRRPFHPGVTVLVVALGAVAGNPSAQAQVAPVSVAPAGGEGGDSGSLSEIIVTGTHIARPELQSAMPISIISVDAARKYGRDTVYDQLLLDPAMGPGLGEMNAGGQEYDQGVANINLRNMGANRSLVVVDGQRWVSGGARTSAVDLNTIPSALIDRYEVVTGGAAAIYGADAVTGAVNIITRKEMTGITVSATSGISGQGDANQDNISAAGGFKFADGRGSVVAGVDYTYTAPLTDYDRWNTRYIYEPNPASTGPHDGIPDNILIDYHQFYRSNVPTFCLYGGANNCGALTGKSYAGQWYQLVNNQVRAIPQSSYSVISPGDTGIQNGGDSYGLAIWDDVLLRNMSQKASAMVKASYEVTPDINWHGVFGYAHSYNKGTPEWPQVRDDARPTNWYGGTTSEIARLTDPYLPDSLRQFMVTNSLTEIPLDRTYSNLPQAFEQHSRNNYSIGTDVDGKVTSKLSWQAFARYGWVTDDITTTNMIGKNEWLAARNTIADPATGQIECADAAARAAGCAPFNFYTSDAPSQAWDNYAEFDRHEWTRNSLLNTGANLNGTVLTLPYGDVSGALGVEWRRETLKTLDDPDAAKLADIIYAPGEDYSLHPALSHARNTTEAFSEVVIPLLKDLPLAKRLEIEGAYRFSHYSDNPSTHTYKYGGNWEPVNGVTFRGTFSRATRVPNFGELYSPPTITTYGHIGDPCQSGTITQNPNRAANCAATIPAWGGPLPNPNLNAPQVYGGGNPNLTPETARTYTVGVVLQPYFLQGFDLSIDYWSIDIDNVITSLAYTTIMNDCVDSAGGPNEGYCQFVHRNADGSVNYVQAQYANLAGQVARGYDVAANYHTPIGPGMFRATLDGTYLAEQTIIAEKGKAGRDYASQWNYPRLKATLMTSYDIGPFAIAVNTRFISRSRYSTADASDETRELPYIGSYVYNDLTLSYHPTERYTASVGVKNITDKQMPAELSDNAVSPHLSNGSISGNSGQAYYDVIGRYFFVKVDAKF